MTKEEAIKIIESNCSCTDSKLREACAMFIPELADSEDERIRKAIIEYFTKMKEATDGKFLLQQDYNKWIAWLEKQKEQSWKPSEQEKGALRTAIYILTDERNFPKTAAQLQNILDVFEGKESRKNWKPSEEQMRYLLAVINDPNNISAESCYMTIKSLYNDLQKLL